jgi:hypothetical protein
MGRSDAKLVLGDMFLMNALNFSTVYLCTIYISKETKHYFYFYIQALIKKRVTLVEVM